MKQAKLAFIIASVLVLQGCVAATAVGVAAGASIATDKRSMGNLIDDQSIEIKAHAKLAKHQSLSDNANLQVVSVNGSVLVVGQAPNTYLRDLAIKTLNEVDGIVQLHNQIRIGNTTSIATRTNDVWLTSKVKTALFAAENLNATNVKVVTENGEVFLMGLVKQEDANAAVEVARNLSGVNRVYKMFEIQ